MSIQSKQIYLGIAASILLAAIFQFWAEHFIYLRVELSTQPWRLWTAHWVHVGWIHYFLNMAALICLALIFPNFNSRLFLSILLVLPVFISVILFIFYPDVIAYAGFSGVLHGLYVAAALQCIIEDKKDPVFCYVVLMGLVIKLVSEYFSTEMSATAKVIGSPILIEAHQWGTLGAVFLFAGYYWMKSRKN